MKLDYLLLDVFTTQPLTGNPLAVFMKAEGLLDDQMQRIAGELNLSESVFVTGISPERHCADLRIFTPSSSCPSPGTPPWVPRLRWALNSRTTAIRLEEKVGSITCVIERLDKRTGLARFMLPRLPVVAGKSPDKNQLAMALGIAPEDIGCGLYQPGVYSAGVTFYTIPVRNASVLKWLAFETHDWNEIFPLDHNSVYALHRDARTSRTTTSPPACLRPAWG